MPTPTLAEVLADALDDAPDARPGLDVEDRGSFITMVAWAILAGGLCWAVLILAVLAIIP